MANITFIGLGVMGGNIARHLAAAGHSMTVYNRTAKKAQDWVSAHGGRCAASPAEAARDADAIFTCVGADDDLAAVTLGRDGAFRTMKSGALLIDHTTVSAKIARQLAVEAKDIGVLTVDAPVTGGQIGAEQGTLTLMCGGSDAGVAAATPLMQAYAKKVVHIGGPGTGQLTKMVNQITFAGIIASLAEGMRFAQAEHLDLGKVFEAISGGAASSWQMTNRWETMTKEEFDFGFAVDWMRKDLGLALEEARANGAAMPLAAMIDQQYAEVQQIGGGRQDTSALIRRLKKV
ncbi:MAG: NAD(P)-dependent oxidoreductase [Alphaproteobacteria bacterium]|nr:NAD(P)-dependent oxidoreductase [Alphaproteobacteria bacterium]